MSSARASSFPTQVCNCDTKLESFVVVFFNVAVIVVVVFFFTRDIKEGGTDMPNKIWLLIKGWVRGVINFGKLSVW